jgi:transcriptional regulator with XRE-family HTH domain
MPGGLPVSEIREAFASGLKQARKAQKLTQHQLAEIAGLSVDTISRLERGDVLPSFDSIDALAAALRISPLQFFSSDLGRSTPRGRALAEISRLLANANDKDVERYARVLKALVGN